MGLRAAALIYLLLLVDKADSEKGFKCGGILSASSGNISSPNFPSRYPYNSDCSWLIVVAEGSSVHLTFHHFELEHHASCSYDYIKIYNGVAEDEGNLLGAFCGDVSPPQFTSSWNVMSIIFHSDRHVAYRGFSVGYRKGAHRGLYLNDLQHVTWGGAWLDLNNNRWVCGKDKKTQLQVALNINMCGGVLTGLSGEISSPGYPLEYNNNADCTWTIRVSNASLVTLVFLDFQLENNEGCNFDFVALFDGPTVTHRHLGNYCGADKPPRVVTTSNNLLVAFKSDFNIGGRGFKAYYYSGECQQVLVAVSGTFSSPRFPNIYPNNINCHWGITQASGYRVKLFFPFLDLEERNSLSGECDYDSVTVYDGDSQADPMLGRWCGGERPPSLVSRGNKLLVVLSTDRNEAHRGFTAAYLGVVPVNVSCTRSEFTILIPQQSLPRLDRESIYLGNPTCTAQLTSTAYKILAQFVNCGTAGQVTKFILSDVLLLLRDLPIHLQKHQNITVLVNKLYIDFSDGKQQNVQEYKVQCDALRKVASVSIISEEERRLEEQAQQSERGTEGAAGDPQAEPHDLSDIVFISICVLAVILMMIAIVWLVLL